MRPIRLAAVAVAFAVLLVGVQVAYTDTGETTGDDWSDPVEVRSVPSAADAGVTSVATAGTDEGGVVAWIERDGDRWTVRRAPLTVDGGTVTVGPTTTVRETDRRLDDVDVGASGDEVAVVWERRATNDVFLHRAGDDAPRPVADALRVEEPSVAMTDRGPLVAWAGYGGESFDVVVATVGTKQTTVDDSTERTTAGDGVERTTIGGPTDGVNSPSVAASGTRYGVAWLRSDENAAYLTTGEVNVDGTVTLDATAELGRAAPRGGFGASGGGSVAAGRTDADASAVWTDTSTVVLAGTDADPVEVGSGRRPGLAVSDDRRLVGWLVDRPGSGLDVVYRYDDGDRTWRGDLSKRSSSAAQANPVFAPDPAMVWVESGRESRLLASAHDGGREASTGARLRTDPQRFAFVGLAAAVLGAVTVPLLPWTFLSLVGAFVLTTRFVSTRLFATGGLLARVATGGRAGGGVRSRLTAVPPLGWATGFAVVETALLAVLIETGAAPQVVSFQHPVPVSAAAFVATGAVALVVRGPFERSTWYLLGLFTYVQTAALWTTVLPSVL